MKKLIKGLSVLLILVLLVSCGGQKKEGVLKSSDGSYSVTINTEEELESAITRFGNIIIYPSSQEFLETTGFSLGDIVKVTFQDQSFILPVVGNYAYLDNGESGLIMENHVELATNLSSFAENYSVAERNEEDDAWSANSSYTYPMVITFVMEEEDGFADIISDLDALVITNRRKDYENLSDREFANFRLISGNVYRSASPIDPDYGRALEADAAAEEAGIRTVLNLTDTEEEAVVKEFYRNSYYSTLNVCYLAVSVDPAADSFLEHMKEGVLFMLSHEGPYLVHCSFGKDRAGMVAMLFRALAGFSLDEIVADYMVTYYNYYGLDSQTNLAKRIIKSNVYDNLERAFHLNEGEIHNADLTQCAVSYFKRAGLSQEEIDQLTLILKQPYSF